MACRDHLTCNPAYADIAGSTYMSEHALAWREVPEWLPVPRPPACVEQPILSGYGPAVVIGSAEHAVEVPAVPWSALSPRWSLGRVSVRLWIEQPCPREVITIIVAEVPGRTRR